MPELPEVQTVVDSLKSSILEAEVVRVIYCDNLKGIRSQTVSEFEDQVKGRKIVDVRRRAKNILIYLSDSNVLHVHLKMTGHFLVMPLKYKISTAGRWVGENLPAELTDPINQFIHLSIELSNGRQLAFSDMRKFGFLHIISAGEVVAIDANHGPEPVGNPDFTYEAFVHALTGTNVQIKAALLDQKRIAGIGNIYGDEILFLAHVRPDRLVKSLNAAELAAIYEQIEPVLSEAIEQRGTSIGDFRDPTGHKGVYQESRRVYGREGKPCLVCATPISRIKVGQRSAHFCTKCQK